MRTQTAERAGDRGRLCALVIAAGLCMAVGSPAAAQEASDSGWEFFVTPYVWLPSLEASTRGQGIIPPSETETDILDLLNIAAESTFELRKDRMFVLVDLSYVDLSADQSLGGMLFTKGEVEIAGILGSVNGGYRIVDQGRVAFDLFAGVQVVSLDVDLDLAGMMPASVSTTETLIDPIVGARLWIGLGDDFFLNAIGDVGGFGVDSELTWQAIGAVGWQANDWLAFQLGYRHFEVDFKKGDLMDNLTMTGPIFGATFRL